MKEENRKIVFLGTLIFFVILAGCQKEAPVPLRVGIDQFVGFAPVYLARDRGMYKRLGVEVEPQMIIDTVERNSALASGRIDALCTTADSLLLAAAKGLDLRIIAAVDESLGADGIIVRPSINSVQDLRNRTVAFQEAMPSHFFLLWVLGRSAMGKRDVLGVNMNADEAGAAFMAGKVDAAVTWEPWLSQAAKSGKGKILVSSKDFPGVLVDVLAVREEVFKRRERDLVALYRGWMQAVDLAEREPEESARLMSSKINLPIDVFRQNLSTVRFANDSFNRKFFDKSNAESIWKLGDEATVIWKKAGVIDPAAEFSPSRYISEKVIRDAASKP
jgi:NitT/TauT family transport system substrate-binding protein